MPRIRENTINKKYADLNPEGRAAVLELTRLHLNSSERPRGARTSGYRTDVATGWTDVVRQVPQYSNAKTLG
jgi:hypothetical protein